MSFHFCFVPSCKCYNMPSTRNSARDVGINEQRKGLEEVPGGNLEGAEDTWAPSQPVQLLQVSKEGNVWNMVSVSAPLPPHWLFFQLKNQERGHSAVFKALQVIDWLFIHQDPQCSDRGDEWKQPQSSCFLQNLYLRPFLIKKKKVFVSILSHNTPFKQLLSKLQHLFIQQETFIHLEETSLAPENSNKHTCHGTSWAEMLKLGPFQPPSHHWACRTWGAWRRLRKARKSQFSAGQLQHLLLSSVGILPCTSWY